MDFIKLEQQIVNIFSVNGLLLLHLGQNIFNLKLISLRQFGHKYP
jgi:hypothetical protein